MEDEEEASFLSGSSKHSSPVPSPLQHTTASSDKNPVKDKANSSQKYVYALQSNNVGSCYNCCVIFQSTKAEFL